jgi:hypothetical protein
MPRCRSATPSTEVDRRIGSASVGSPQRRTHRGVTPARRFVAVIGAVADRPADHSLAQIPVAGVQLPCRLSPGLVLDLVVLTEVTSWPATLDGAISREPDRSSVRPGIRRRRPVVGDALERLERAGVEDGACGTHGFGPTLRSGPGARPSGLRRRVPRVARASHRQGIASLGCAALDCEPLCPCCSG